MESANATGRTDWETPPEFFKKYDDMFHFTLDVCASESNHKVEKYFSEKDDGLEQSWAGQVCWCNPPYGRGAIDKWVRKAGTEAAHNAATVVMLLPARTSTSWFHDYIYGKRDVGIIFIRGRLKFVGALTGAMFGSMVVVFHPWTETDRLWRTKS